MERPKRAFIHQWHVAINKHNHPLEVKDWKDRKWMYDAKQIADEQPRLVILFKMERDGTLPTAHQQCSRSEPEPVVDNHLTCCLGVKCKECPVLLSLEAMAAAPEEIDVAKSWTCVAHILTQDQMIDTSEGYIMTEDDKMYWQNVYSSLSGAP